jgi:hypothetical protein
MHRYAKFAAALAVALTIVDAAGISAACARGGGSSFMNSPGYQRRLQESRGYVTNRSGSLSSTSTAPSAPVVIRKRRHYR